MLQSKLSNAEPALQQANQQLESARIEAQEGVRAAARNARICTALQERLLELEDSTRKAEEQRAADASAAAARLTDLHSAFTASLERAAQARDTLAQQLHASMLELEAARQARETAETTAVDRMRQRSAAFDEALATAVAARVAVEEKIVSLQTEIEAGEARRESERNAERERSAAREAEFAADLAQVTDDRDALAVELRDATSVIEQARRQQDQDAAEIERLARREAQLLDQLTHEVNARTSLEQQLDHTTTDLRETKERYDAELATAASELSARDTEIAARDAEIAARNATIDTRDTELAALQADSLAMQTTLEARLDDAGRALQRAEHVADLERLAASVRERSLEDAVAREAAGRTAAEGALGVARAAFAQGRRRLLNAASALRRRSATRRSQLEREIAERQASFEQQIGTLGTSLVESEREVADLRTTLGTSRADLHALTETRQHEQQEFEQTRARDRSEIDRVTAEHRQTREALDQLRAAFNTLEQVSSEHALERARLEGVVTDRDARISAQEAAARAAEHNSKDTLHRVEAELQQIIVGKTTDIAALESDLHGVRGDLQRVTQDAETLRSEANRIPSLMRQIESARQDARQQFERSPSALLRTGRDGSLLDVNPSLARLLGYRTTTDCASLELEGIFESPADMHWLLEHAGGNHPEPIETIWKKKDRSRLTVRLRVVRTKEEWIEFAVEDVTRLRALEQDLQHARRMESVGRLASEVATTCDTLLRGVSHGGRQWMSAFETDARMREQGERLVGDVDHAVSLLQHFTTYGHEQAAAGEPVDLRRVFNNLAPVLKRVAGDDIELVLPKHIRHFDVDVERARVERVLINVTSYARERMPQGGRLKIDLAPTVVDREFLQKYPNVRPGAHVLATVTEERSTTPRVHASEIVTGLSAPVATAKPALDLSILVRILGECGGHLWVTAEPSGNMTLKIHLPLRAAADAEAVTSSALATAPLARTLGRWFRH